MPLQKGRKLNDLRQWLQNYPVFHLTAGEREHETATCSLCSDSMMVLQIKIPDGTQEYCIHQDKIIEVFVGEKVVQIETSIGLFTLVAPRKGK